jgi:PST family polysaccharide transporter
MFKRKVLSASLWTLVGNAGQQLISFFLFIYLTRALTVEDFGLMGLAVAFIDVISLLGRFGQVEALQQRETLSRETASTAFWILLVIGLGSLMAICLLATPLAHMLHEPRLAGVLLALSPVCLFLNIGQVHEAFVKRELKYQLIARRSVAAALVSATTAFLAAYNGLGVYALVLQRLAYNLVYSGTLLVTYYWRPRLTFDLREAKDLAVTGLNISASNTISILNLRIIDFLVGVFLGVKVLGYLRVAWRFFDFVSLLVVQPISSVYLATLSSIQSDAAHVRRAYLRFLQIISCVVIPTFLGLGSVAPSFVEVVFGTRWLPSVSIFQMLAVASLSIPIGFLFPPTMIILRRTDTVRSQAIWQAVATATLTFIAVHFNIAAVIGLHVLRALGFALFNGRTMNRALAIPPLRIWRSLFPPIAASLVMVAATLVVTRLLGMASPALVLVAATLAGGLTFLAGMTCGDWLGLWRGYLGDIIEFFRDALRRAPQAGGA